MQIDLYIDGEKKTFSAPFVPMAAKRKYLEVQASIEERKETAEQLSPKDIIEEDQEMASILTDIIFKDKFTLDELYNGASQKQIDDKLAEAVFGVNPDKLKDAADPGN